MRRILLAAFIAAGLGMAANVPAASAAVVNGAVISDTANLGSPVTQIQYHHRRYRDHRGLHFIFPGRRWYWHGHWWRHRRQHCYWHHYRHSRSVRRCVWRYY